MNKTYYVPDYDTQETVTCKAHFIYDQDRQRNLQHFLQIEDLPECFHKVDIPSGNEESSGLLTHISICRYLFCVWIPSKVTEKTDAICCAGEKKAVYFNLHSVCVRCTCRVPCL